MSTCIALIPLVLLFLPVVAATNASFSNATNRHTACLSSACTACDTCPSDKLFQQLQHCKDSLYHLQLYFQGPPPPPLNITRDCSFKRCYPSQRRLNCALLPNQPSPDFPKQLQSALRAKTSELSQLRNRKRSQHHQKLVLTGLQAYHDKLQNLRRLVRKKRDEAFQLRAYNAKLRHYLQSIEFRQKRQQVLSKRHESRTLRSNFAYWKHMQSMLSRVVTLSPAAVRDARDKLKRRKEQYEADVELLRVVRRDGTTREDQVRVVSEMKAELEGRLDHIRSVNAHARAEIQFIEKAREEVVSLLTGILDAVRQRTSGVTCGGGAIGRLVTDAMVE